MSLWIPTSLPIAFSASAFVIAIAVTALVISVTHLFDITKVSVEAPEKKKNWTNSMEFRFVADELSDDVTAFLTGKTAKPNKSKCSRKLPQHEQRAICAQAKWRATSEH